MNLKNRISLIAWFFLITSTSHPEGVDPLPTASVPKAVVDTSVEDYRLAYQDYQTGQYAQAVSAYQKVVQENPNYWQAYQSLGIVLIKTGDRSAALQALQKSLEINPNNEPVKAAVEKMEATATVQPTAVAVSQPALSDHFNSIETPSAVNLKIPTNALPKPGSITWSLTGAIDFDNYSDYAIDYFSPNGFSFDQNSLTPIPVGYEFGVGADLTLFPRFQLGLNFEGIEKNTQPVTVSYDDPNFSGVQFSYVDQWTDFCLGLALDAKYFAPLDQGTNFIIRGELGCYQLTGASDLSTFNYPPLQSFNSWTLGGLLGVELEWMVGSGWGLDFGLGYRFLTFESITYTGIVYGYPGTLNTGYEIDFSGLDFTTALRFF